MTDRVHGGPDAHGPVRWDFSTNTNAVGPCPSTVAALAMVDATRYPDPTYAALRRKLANFHDVDPVRILFAASAGEFIQRITAVGQRLVPGPVEVPRLSYGDYAIAARACGRALVRDDEDRGSTLRWSCDPSSPMGHDVQAPADPGAIVTVRDAAYAPLRLEGRSAWSGEELEQVFQLFSPNKALGLPGIRGTYAIAPSSALHGWRDALDAAAPSWPLGVHAVAMLDSWTEATTRAWLRDSLVALRAWTAALRTGLDALGLEPVPSVTPFLCARRPARADAATLRAADIAVRDASSFGLEGWMRVSAQPPDALDALLTTLRRLA